MIRDPRLHRGHDSQRTVDAAEIVMCEMQRNGVLVVLQFLGKAQAQPGEPPKESPHREIVPLDVRGTYLLSIRVTSDNVYSH
jgi:hypothetical protein